MSLTVCAAIISATKDPAFYDDRERISRDRFGADRDIRINASTLSPESLRHLHDVSVDKKDNKTARAINAILLGREGKFDVPVPNFKAFGAILESFLSHQPIDGWIYAEEDDGHLYPRLVVSVDFAPEQSRNNSGLSAAIILTTRAYGLDLAGSTERYCFHRKTYVFHPQSVARRRIADILADVGLYKETPDLRAAYEQSMKRYERLRQDAPFGKQFRTQGNALRFVQRHYNRKSETLEGRRAIYSLQDGDFGPSPTQTEAPLFGEDEVRTVPEHPVAELFDLNTHEFYWVHSDNLVPYVYDKSLREKLILPASHRDLLDVLTTDLSAFIGDIIEGKSSGNVVLCKGVPGTGKTLTAEVYSELIERPLYKIHSGSLGTTAKEIEKNLAIIFDRCKQWKCVLLLDEADVFVVERGSNIEQNAIVAEFLRVLEYFDGLLFMTTNRPDDIDEAILSRCAAIIDYHTPTADHARAIWEMLAAQHKVTLDPNLADELVKRLGDITARDIKMLLRLALRVSMARNEPLDLEMFRRCAMFRGLTMAEPATIKNAQ